MKKKTETGTTSELVAEVPLEIDGLHVKATSAELGFTLKQDENEMKMNASELNLTLTSPPEELEALFSYISSLAQELEKIESAQNE